jgi:hypothetical protein
MICGTDFSAFDGSGITRGTIAAYPATNYRIWGDWQLALRIGHRSTELASLYQSHAVASAAVATAWSPFSERRA